MADKKRHSQKLPYLRVSVSHWDDETITCTTHQPVGAGLVPARKNINVDYSEIEYLKDILRKNMQLNLLDISVDNDDKLKPGLIIVCPDYLIDISSLATCFREYGHHPLNYFINKIKTKPVTWQILLGNLAGQFLDEYVHETNDNPVNYAKTLNKFFASNALDFCTCNIPVDFHERAKKQMDNIRLTVHELLPKTVPGFDRSKTLLEASFLCERLGLQGRVDMLQDDMKILIEQKSGKRDEYRSRHKEDHFVQMLLYQGVLEQNFGKAADKLRSFLFYSKYPDGLMPEPFLDTFFKESINLRNKIVAGELSFAEGGIEEVMDKISTDLLNEKRQSGKLWKNYQEPELRSTINVLKRCSPLEKAYFKRFFTFVTKETLISKTGGTTNALFGFSGTWHLDIKEKIENGDILCGLRIISEQDNETVCFSVPYLDEGYMPNFRKGDIVIVYPYRDIPDVRSQILMKGNIADISTDSVTVRLRNKRNLESDNATTFAIEHDSSDITATMSVRGLYSMLLANQDRRNLLLSQRTPAVWAHNRAQNVGAPLACARKSTLNGNYGQFNHLVLKMKLCKDYFLLAGPPGTGKTSCALRYMVEETLTDNGSSILLMSYTNRAVDEICDMLVSSGIADRHPFIRIGNELSCDKRFTSYLLSNSLEDCPKLTDIRNRLTDTRIFVATTTAIASRPNLFNIKRFDVAFIDESSQILEPDIVGILSARSGNDNAIRKFVMIGDYKQLPAVAQQSAASAKVDDPLLNEIGLTDCRNSLFERLYKQSPDHAKDVLRTQGRMHPDISQFPCKAFYSSESLMPVPLPHQTEQFPYSQTTDDILTTHRMIFVPVACTRESTNNVGADCVSARENNNVGATLVVARPVSDKVNKDEAIVVASLLERIYRLTSASFDPNKTVGVIVPYRNQITMIRNEVSKLGIPDLMNISIDTVERYQGSGRDVIIYSFTVRNAYQLDFLTENTFIENGKPIDRKLNVALTRARKQIILTGDPLVLSINPLFRQLIEHIRQQGGQVHDLPLN